MATTPGIATGTPLLLVGDVGGITIVEPSTPLRRLNYFDGKFLRADDFTVEQSYLRQLVALSNQGLGPGVVYGYDTTQAAGDSIQIGPGLAIDPSGKVLLLQSTVTQSVQALIDATRKLAAKPADASGKIGGFSDCIEVAAPSPTTVVQTSDLYVIAVCAAEALCGQQDVYGVACQDACVTASDRPYRLDGIVLRAIPLQLVTPFPTSKAVAIDADSYLRSKVADSWFADEQLRHPNAISRAGLLTQVWCLGAGYAFDCCEVPLAVVARSGASTLFLDAWIVRRERIDAPAKRYWQWKMRMRPWDVFLAQVLQFQCQLADLLSGIIVPGGRGADPCAAAHKALDEAAHFVEQVRSGLASYRSAGLLAKNSNQPPLLALSLTGISDLGTRLKTLLKSAATPSQPTDRVLIRGGIIELPPAGYLPVVSGGSISVNDQVRALLGEGLDLRFCITTGDYIAHAVEEAQHMDRISLLQGLDDTNSRPHVDILVPDGKSASSSIAPTAGVYDANLIFSSQETGGLIYKGAAREQAMDAGGTALYMGAAGLSQAVIGKFQNVARAIVNPNARTKATGVTANLDSSAFIAKTGTLGAKADVKVSSAATLARGYIGAYQAGAPAPVGAAASTPESIDGLWLNAGIDKQIRSLGPHGQTPVNLRIVLGSKPATPIAMDLSFHGTLTVSGLATNSTDPNVALVVSGTLNGVLSLGLLEEDQVEEKTVEYLITERYNWALTVTYKGTGSSGPIDFDLVVDPKTGVALRVSKSWLGAVQITYRLALVLPSKAGPPGAVPLGELLLVADADVVDPNNVNHRYAVSGLDLVQAALIVSEPELEANALALLFPTVPAGTEELAIQAVRDWVMFTKRREKQCRAQVVPIPPAPPRRYRVIQLPAESVDDAQTGARTIRQLLHDPANLAKLINELLAKEEKRQRPKLVVEFAGGSATALSDLKAVGADWKSFFNPGSAIYYAAIGAVGDSSIDLQFARLKTLEGAIGGSSQEVPPATEDAMIPYPQDAVPDDADGIVLVVTLEPIHVYAANSDRYQQLLKLADTSTSTAATWKQLLDQVTDLGIANFTPGPGAAVAVNDAAVKSQFQTRLPNGGVELSALISRKGSSADAISRRKAASQQVVDDLGGQGASVVAQTNAGAWPLNDAPAMLVVQVFNRDPLVNRPG